MWWSAISLAMFFLPRLVASTSMIAAAAARQHSLRHAGHSFISSLQFKHRLRVCNAYPWVSKTGRDLDVYLGKEKLTDSPMPYKTCNEFHPSLKPGDKLDFKVGGSNAGSFSVSDLPENDAILVLVMFRHDTMSTAVSFESHVFSNAAPAQVAVLDAYRGSAKSTPHIQDSEAHRSEDDKKPLRSEELRYNSVVAVNPGLYEVALLNNAGESRATHELVAINRESYVVVRCGVEAAEGQAYPEELIVYPHSDPRDLSGAPMSKQSLWAAALVVAVVSSLL